MYRSGRQLCRSGAAPPGLERAVWHAEPWGRSPPGPDTAEGVREQAGGHPAAVQRGPGCTSHRIEVTPKALVALQLQPLSRYSLEHKQTSCKINHLLKSAIGVGESQDFCHHDHWLVLMLSICKNIDKKSSTCLYWTALHLCVTGCLLPLARDRQLRRTAQDQVTALRSYQRYFFICNSTQLSQEPRKIFLLSTNLFQ